MYEKYVKKITQHYFTLLYTLAHAQIDINILAKGYILYKAFMLTYVDVLPYTWPYIIGCWLPDIVNTIIVIPQTTKHYVVVFFFFFVFLPPFCLIHTYVYYSHIHCWFMFAVVREESKVWDSNLSLFCFVDLNLIVMIF